MPDLANITITGKVGKVLGHTGTTFSFLIMSDHGETITYLCHASGAVAAYLPGKIEKGDPVIAMGKLTFKNGNPIIAVYTVYRVKTGFGREGLKIRPKSSHKTEHMLDI